MPRGTKQKLLEEELFVSITMLIDSVVKKKNFPQETLRYYLASILASQALAFGFEKLCAIPIIGGTRDQLFEALIKPLYPLYRLYFGAKENTYFVLNQPDIATQNYCNTMQNTLTYYFNQVVSESEQINIIVIEEFETLMASQDAWATTIPKFFKCSAV